MLRGVREKEARNAVSKVVELSASACEVNISYSGERLNGKNYCEPCTRRGETRRNETRKMASDLASE